jgi:hypothetical protein
MEPQENDESKSDFLTNKNKILTVKLDKASVDLLQLEEKMKMNVQKVIEKRKEVEELQKRVNKSYATKIEEENERLKADNEDLHQRLG